ncbi:hypothetical protein J3R30DRAFT_3501174 [Lentinula aciculospora]|uniref:DUF6699 domain-containing protein n=1 Tax=Lentinula aciculospora TaxID=153920 RepID=A0A9W9DKY8_9AGAR|nr:hypothetical protein J3R30DRAFT_3501174 [Lentinula aciculospora]
MASEMFIPPLGTPQPSPRNPPVLPDASNATPPAWAAAAGQYPMFNSPMSGNPYIPPYFTPASATPAMLPRGTPYGAPQALPNQGYSADYTGYPRLDATPQWGPTPMGSVQHSPWAQPQTPHWAMPNSAPTMGTPWPGMSAVLPGGQPLPGMPPHSANPWGMPPMMHQGFGPPQMHMQGMGPPMMHGPVLEPFLTHVLHVVPKLNPLIKPAPLEIGDPDHDYLKWNMLWASNMVQRSNDNSRTSWSDGRNSPATFPRITSMRLLPNLLPFSIDVFARNPDIGVTCGDVIDAISDSMRKHSGQSDFDSLPTDRKQKVSSAYRHNRSRAPGVPGGILGDGLRRLDFLGAETMFGGIKEDPIATRRICGEVLPCTWILDCTTRFPMTSQEMADHAETLRLQAEQQREHGRREEEASSRRSQRSSRAPTIVSVTDEDDRSSTDDTVRG